MIKDDEDKTDPYTRKAIAQHISYCLEMIHNSAQDLLDDPKLELTQANLPGLFAFTALEINLCALETAMLKGNEEQKAACIKQYTYCIACLLTGNLLDPDTAVAVVPMPIDIGDDDDTTIH